MTLTSVLLETLKKMAMKSQKSIFFPDKIISKYKSLSW